MIQLRTVGAADWAAIEGALGGDLHPPPDLALLSQLVVAEDEGTAVGVAAMEVSDTAGLLRLLFVRPGHRSQGLGTRIVRHAALNGFDHGLASVFVSAIGLEAFFYRAGFGPDDIAFLPRCFRPRIASDRTGQASLMSCRRVRNVRLSLEVPPARGQAAGDARRGDLRRPRSPRVSVSSS